jgi:hypothetical protein
MNERNLPQVAAMVKENWRKNHRHHGPLALLRCVAGSAGVAAGMFRREKAPAGVVNCVAFSVIPRLTGLWANFMHRAIPGNCAEVIIGDSSGGFKRRFALGAPVRVVPIVNLPPGIKFDIFFEQSICNSEYIVSSDDDVIWLSDAPWRWAKEQFDRDERLAVVSFVPRERFQWDIEGRKYDPMGSYCLILRRDIWVKEGLRMRGVPKPSPNTASYAGHYDTGDFANVELLKRGYRILIAPPEIRQQFTTFKGISGGLLRVQKEPADGYANVTTRPAPLLESCLVAKALGRLLTDIEGSTQHVVRPDLLERAERELRPLVGDIESGEIEEGVNRQLELLRSRMTGVMSPAAALEAVGGRS